jgi:hypothetical protein
MSDTTVVWHDLTVTIPRAVVAEGGDAQDAYEAAALEAACQEKHGMSRAAYEAARQAPEPPPASPAEE